MNDEHDAEHPAKAELRRLLASAIPQLGLGDEAVELLVRKAKIVRSLQTVASSDDEGGFLHFVVRGVVRVELTAPGRRQPSIFRFVRSGEFCCLPPGPRDRPYRLRAMAHAARGEERVATLAIWSSEAVVSVVGTLSPEGVVRLLTTTWRAQARFAAEERLLREMPLADRIAFVAEDLAARFGVPGADGVLIDLPLGDDVLAQLVGATRARVNKSIHHAPELKGVLRREAREFLVLLHQGGTPCRRESGPCCQEFAV